MYVEAVCQVVRKGLEMGAEMGRGPKRRHHATLCPLYKLPRLRRDRGAPSNSANQTQSGSTGREMSSWQADPKAPGALRVPQVAKCRPSRERGRRRRACGRKGSEKLVFQLEIWWPGAGIKSTLYSSRAGERVPAGHERATSSVRPWDPARRQLIGESLEQECEEKGSERPPCCSLSIVS